MRLGMLLLIARICLGGPQHYAVRGLVLATDPQRKTVTISHESIPGFMDAMAMPFEVRPGKIAAEVQPGESVTFTLVVDRSSSWVEDLRAVPFESAERDPVQASRLKVLETATGGTATPALKAGEKVPDFRLTDQDGRAVTLSSFAGKVVAIDFVYTRCPLPDYCFRLSNNFARLQRRFGGSADLALLTVTFDPAHDGPRELARYARVWHADTRMWHFLTGPAADIQVLCARFGVGYWPDEGVFVHSLHTAVLDREGRLAANLEGNKFTAGQLGDLVQTVLAKKPGRRDH